jgi:hypothetical protein
VFFFLLLCLLLFLLLRTKERKFPTQNLKAAAAIYEVEDISLKDYDQYERRWGTRIKRRENTRHRTISRNKREEEEEMGRRRRYRRGIIMIPLEGITPNNNNNNIKTRSRSG